MLVQNQKPRRERRREAPPFSSWFLCPDTLGDSYKRELSRFARQLSSCTTKRQVKSHPENQ